MECKERRAHTSGEEKSGKEWNIVSCKGSRETFSAESLSIKGLLPVPEGLRITKGSPWSLPGLLRKRTGIIIIIISLLISLLSLDRLAWTSCCPLTGSVCGVTDACLNGDSGNMGAKPHLVMKFSG